MLRLDLFGLFVEEQSLLDLAAMPFGREFRLLGGGWHPINLDQLAREIDAAARNMERLFRETARGLPTAARFQIVRGSLAETIAAVPQSGDIVIVPEPMHPGEHAAHQFPAMVNAALRSAAAVMLVPRRVVRRSGAIVAIAANADDPSITTAAAIAAAAHEELVIVETFKAPNGRRNHVHTINGVRTRYISVGRALVGASGIAAALGPLHERLVVTNRSDFDASVPTQVASIRRVPVLVIEASR